MSGVSVRLGPSKVEIRVVSQRGLLNQDLSHPSVPFYALLATPLTLNVNSFTIPE